MTLVSLKEHSPDDVFGRGHRDTMARMGSSVAIVTTDGPHGRAGFTASVLCSVTV